MKVKSCFSLLVIAPLLASAAAFAQDSGYHPALQDNFKFSAGAFRSTNSLTLSAGITGTGKRDVDFGDQVGVDEDSTIANVQLRWKFGEQRKWSVWGQYFSSDASGKLALENDVEWQDVVFRKGTFVDGGVKLQVNRVFFGRSFAKNEQQDFGVGAGIHVLDLSAYIGGQIKVNDDSSGYRRVEAGASPILPNLGAWYDYSPARKWLLHGRLDWLSADIGDFDGSIWNANLGVTFQPWRHAGFDLAYQYFNLNVNVDKSDWQGGADMTYSGPVVSLTVNW